MSPKLRARNAVKMALRSGRMAKGPCVFADGCEGVVEAHHEDYAQPLTVWWVCKRHHDDMTWREIGLPAGAPPAVVAAARKKAHPLTHHTQESTADTPMQARLRKYWQGKRLKNSGGVGDRTRDLGIKRPLTATAATGTDTAAASTAAPGPQQPAVPEARVSASTSPTKSPQDGAAA